MNEALNALKGSREETRVVEAPNEQKPSASQRASFSKRGAASHRGEGAIVRETSGDTKNIKTERNEEKEK